MQDKPKFETDSTPKVFTGPGGAELVAESTTVMNTTEAPKEITKLESGANLKDVIAKINELVDRTNSKRDRGPESQRVMTEDDARRIMLGDLKDVSHTKAATALGLSYGQVYSARKGFTFKTIFKEYERAQREAAKKH